MLKSRKHPGGFSMWSLGDGVPEPKPHDYEPDEPLRRKFDERKPRPMVPSKPPVYTPPAPTPAPAPKAAEPEPVAEPDTDRAKFGVYSDGTFCVQRGAEAIWLTASETTELMRFLGARK